MLDRPESGERVLLVHCLFGSKQEAQEEDLDEFRALVVSAGAQIVDVVIAKRDLPDPKYFIGSGKAEEIAELVAAQDIQTVLVNHALSPTQERNLETILKARVCDRTGVILDIFASRARTFEGQLQVELAQLSHMATRLVRGWTHLERQGGGIGSRGPGETQLETDRRLLRNRVKMLKEKLDKVREQRSLSRKSRQKQGLFTVALVGYTNAGKSTLFNYLAKENVYAADQLFATLDPTSRQIELRGVGSVVLIDTVGFIRHLPHALIDAFRATLEETQQADLLLHVVDASDIEWPEKVAQVNEVLEEIGANDVPTLMLFNKVDQLEIKPENKVDETGRVTQLAVSAVTGQGLDELGNAIASHIEKDMCRETIVLPPDASRLRGKLYDAGAVTHETTQEDGSMVLTICIRKAILDQIMGSKN
ncbi:MAG: ribosome rescue GTPase HflX [Gammaproteobacteria bacterium]